MLVVGLGCGSASADSSDFLAAFAGQWRGQGMARENPKAELKQIRCSLSASFDAGSKTLTTSGKCGTTQGTRSLDGTMRATSSGISGQLMGTLPDEHVISQGSSLQGDTLLTDMTFRTGGNGKLVRVRTRLDKPAGGGFAVHSQLYDDAAQRWVNSADITFAGK